MDLEAIFCDPEILPPATRPTDASATWQAALDIVDGHRLFPPAFMSVLRDAEVRWEGPSEIESPTGHLGNPGN